MAIKVSIKQGQDKIIKIRITVIITRSRSHAWIAKRDRQTFSVDKQTNPPAFVISVVCYTTTSSSQVQPAPINIDSCLLDVVMQLRDSDVKEMSFNAHIDLYAGLNIRHLHLRQWVITKYPYIVQNYMKFDNKEKFKPLALYCAIEDAKGVEDDT